MSMSAPSTPKPLPPCRSKHLPCPYPGCDKLFNRPTRLEEHKRSHTNDRIFKCNVPKCGKDFLRDSHLKRHVLSAHTDQRDYICTFEDCDKGFATAQRLKRHLSLHEGREKYRCRIDGCGQTFRKHATLDKHQRTAHEGGDAFPCHEPTKDGIPCPKGFDTAYALKLHKGRCHGAKSYFCTLCPGTLSEDPSSQQSLGLGFGTYADLQAHNALVHPPTCPSCSFAARTQKELQHHISQRHISGPPNPSQSYICPHDICRGQTFARKTNLTTHLKTVHSSTRAFVCGTLPPSALNNIPTWTGADACGRAFKAKQGLEEHIRTAHLGLDNRTTARQKRLGTHIVPVDKNLANANQRGKDTTLGKLTGTAYAENPKRTIPCAVLGCAYLFTRHYDHELHLRCKHGVSPEDVPGLVGQREPEWLSATATATFSADLAADNHHNNNHDDWAAEFEAGARHGGSFWIGGVGQAEEFGGDEDDGQSGFSGVAGNFAKDRVWDGEAREMFDLVDGTFGDDDEALAQDGNDFEGDAAMQPIDPMLF
ncbi:MAG: hypothetical protein LQ340_004099 [Diploschistes diacapsis]|nr:MAG: hypothetical protein LQ340_004099 [Diploschistes diacapsis]